jgi:hypothetical protein
MRPSLIALMMGVAVTSPGLARAQYVPQPDGSLALPNGNGTYTIIYPQRLAPGAELVVPGTGRTFPGGSVYLGGDGRVHGNLIDPSGNVHQVKADDGRRPTASPPTASHGGTNVRSDPRPLRPSRSSYGSHTTRSPSPSPQPGMGNHRRR